MEDLPVPREPCQKMSLAGKPFKTVRYFDNLVFLAFTPLNLPDTFFRLLNCDQLLIFPAKAIAEKISGLSWGGLAGAVLKHWIMTENRFG